MNELKKQASIAILLSNKMDFKPKLIRRDREGYLILIKRKIQQDDILVLSIIYPKHKGTQVHKKTHEFSLNHILPLTYVDWETSISHSH